MGERKQNGNNGTALKVFNQSRNNFNKKKNSGKKSPFPYPCYKCGKKGHMAKDCWSKRRTEQQANEAKNDKREDNDNEIGFTIKEVANQLAQNPEKEEKINIWCVDSGATSHMCANKSMFSEIRPYKSNKFVKLVNGDKVEIHGIGTAHLTVNSGKGTKGIKLYNTLYIP